MANPMNVMANIAPDTMVTPTKTMPTNAMGKPTTRKRSSVQVRLVNGVSMSLRANSSSRDFGSDPQGITDWDELLPSRGSERSDI